MFKSQSLLFNILKSLHIFMKFVSHLELVVNLSNLGPHIGVIYKFLLNQEMTFHFQVNILEISLHTMK
jgi:hypothetical protein